MKYAIIICDLCGGRIYKDGWFAMGEGAISIRAKELEKVRDMEFDRNTIYSQWKRTKYHICPKCVGKIKEICKGGASNE